MLTRKFLKGMGLTDEQTDSIIDQHTETVDALKAQIETYKADAEILPGVKKDLEKAKSDLESANKDSWKVKYDAIKEEFDTYKDEQTKKETRAAKETAYRELLKEAGISEKRIPAVMKVSDIEGVELENGKIKDIDSLKKSIKEEWADFIPTTETQGASVSKPPANTGGTAMTKEEIMKITDHNERLRAIAQHKDLFKGGN